MASLYDMFGIINQLIGTWNKKARELGNAWKQNDFNFNTCARFQGFHVVFTFTIIQMVAGFSCSYMVCRFQVLSLFLVFQSVQSVQQEKVTDNVFVAFIAFFACGTTIILRFLGCSEFGNRLSSFEVALLHILYQHADERETNQKNRKSMAEEECMNFEERKQSSLISCCAQGSF